MSTTPIMVANTHLEAETRKHRPDARVVLDQRAGQGGEVVIFDASDEERARLAGDLRLHPDAVVRSRRRWRAA